MKKEKLILNLISLFVTFNAILSFKNQHRSSGARTLWTKDHGSPCIKHACWTTSGGPQNNPCPSAAFGYRTALKVSGVTQCDNLVFPFSTTTNF